MTKTVAEVLKGARKLIEKPENWIKGSYSHNGCFCAMGAIYMSVPRGKTRKDLASKAAKSVSAAAGCLFGGADYINVVSFNDHPSTVHGEVLAAFDKAIELEASL